MIRAVVVEDEPLARGYLRSLLTATGKVEVVGEAGDGSLGFALCHDLAPDAAFLDIRLPGPDGLDLGGRLLTLPRPPLVVFVTGYAGHAVDAFRVEAVDYLLKPIEPDQVLDAVRRLEHRLSAVAPAAPPAEVAGTRLPVRGGDDDLVRLLARGDVLAAVRRARRTWVYTAAEAFPTYYALAALTKWLGGPPFEQVARDAVVNMTAVADVLRTGDRLYRLRLSDHAGTVVDVSRSGAARLAAYLKPRPEPFRPFGQRFRPPGQNDRIAGPARVRCSIALR